MSRTIKFRAWDGKFMWNDSELLEIPYGTMQKPLKNNDWELMQFTGLLDKNGKEIYANGLLKLPRGKAHPILEIFKVVFLEGSYGLFDKNDIHYRWLNLETANESESIGNIHQNPELL